MPIAELAALAALLAASAFFALSESAVTALSALRMKRLLLDRPGLRPYFQEWLGAPHRLLSVLMIGNNLVNFGFSTVAALAAVPARGRWGATTVDLTVWVGVLFALLVFGEIVPKIVGRTYRERVTEWTLPLLGRLTRAFFFVWGPVGWALGRWAPQWNRSPTNPLTVVSLEELHHAVAESRAAGQMTEESSALFQRALAFAQKTVGEIATPRDRVESVGLEVLDRPGGAELFLDLLVETGHSRVPATRNGDVVGFVYVSDLLRADRRRGEDLGDMVLRPLRRVPPEMKAADLLAQFRASGEAVAWVESGGRSVGLVTLEDVLEEIVGEILDEYDLEEKRSAS